jgi:hypothetical protein
VLAEAWCIMQQLQRQMDLVGAIVSRSVSLYYVHVAPDRSDPEPSERTFPKW